MSRALRSTLATLVIVASCGGAGTAPEASNLPDLPPITGPQLEAHLTGSPRPAIVNIWASWCLPCRAEAPLLDRAFATYGDQIEFIGIDVQDDQENAKRFLAEFGLEFTHYFDADRSVPRHFGGIGIPITFFFTSGGDLMHTHNGIIDERTLALRIDELLLSSG